MEKKIPTFSQKCIPIPTKHGYEKKLCAKAEETNSMKMALHIGMRRKMSCRSLDHFHRQRENETLL